MYKSVRVLVACNQRIPIYTQTKKEKLGGLDDGPLLSAALSLCGPRAIDSAL